LAQRSGRSPLHPIWRAFGDRRLASGRTCESTDDRARRDTRAGSKRKPSRDRSRDQHSPRRTRESWRWKASRTTRVGCPSRGTCQGSLGSVERSVRCESSGRNLGRATGMSEARLVRGCAAEDATREPEEPAEADPGAVKRRVPQSLSPGASLGERARRKSRKDAGNTRGASARSRSSGKQKSVGTHRARAPRTVARQVGKGRASPSQTVRSADADGGSPSFKRIGSEGRSGAGPKAWSLAAEALGHTSVRAKRCAGVTPERHNK